MASRGGFVRVLHVLDREGVRCILPIRPCLFNVVASVKGRRGDQEEGVRAVLAVRVNGDAVHHPLLRGVHTSSQFSFFVFSGTYSFFYFKEYQKFSKGGSVPITRYSKAINTFRWLFRSIFSIITNQGFLSRT